jgi:signal transduction histidine kinase
MHPTSPLSAELGSVMLSTLGLAETIEWHLHQVRKRTGIRCELGVKATERFDLPEEHAEALFDIYNGALCNIVGDARATRVAVDLAVSAEEAALTVTVNLPIARAPS